MAKEALIRRWAHAPWHAWIKDEPLWLDLLAELMARLPEGVLKKVLFAARPLVVLPPVHFGRIVRLNKPLLMGANLLQLDSKLLDRPSEEALGILAHEIAHLCATMTEDELANDLAADRLAITWGFREELLKALERDLDGTHPRVLAAQAA